MNSYQTPVYKTEAAARPEASNGPARFKVQQ